MVRVAAAPANEMGAGDGRHIPRQSRSHRLVEQIVDAAARVLSGGGQAALTTNAVADEALVSVGSLYRYFPNKEALIVAVIEREGRRFHDRIMAEIGSREADGLRSLVRSIVKVLVDAYGSIAADDPVQMVSMQRGGLFDRKTAALTAITSHLRSLALDGGGERSPVVAEIIVALLEASVARPTARLSATTVEATAIAAVIGYCREAE